jgi:antitoxin component YwqK of YwqJK toxin-antitoxin module
MANIMTRIFTLILVVFISFSTYGQERKWSRKTNDIEYDMTYEVAKKSFIIKKINDSTFTVKVNKLIHAEEYPYSQDFLYDTIGKPNGKLIVHEKKGKCYAILNYYNGKQIGTNTTYWKKNRKFVSTTYDSSHVVIADSSFYDNGKLHEAFNKAECSFRQFHQNGKVATDVIINYKTNTAIRKYYDNKGEFLYENSVENPRQYWP